MASNISKIELSKMKAVLRGVLRGGQFGDLVSIASGAANAYYLINQAADAGYIQRVNDAFTLTDLGRSLIVDQDAQIRFIEPLVDVVLERPMDPWAYFPPKGRFEV